MHHDVAQRCGITTEHWLADGGFARLQAIEQLHARGTRAVAPPGGSSLPRATLTQWRPLMSRGESRALYHQREASVKYTNAQLGRRCLHQFNVRSR